MASLSHIFPHGFLPPSEIAPQPPEVQLRVAMSDAGIAPPDEIIMDGTLRRFSTNGRKGDLSGWYIAHDGDLPAGAFGDWKLGLEQTWRADIGREFSFQETLAHAARMREMKAKREKELAESRENAAQNAAEIWDAAHLASDDHPYIKRKCVSNPGWRLAPDGRLIAPLYSGGEMVSLQYIAQDGSKLFLKGGKTGGAWWSIGGGFEGDGRIYIAEGVATAASIFEATGRTVVIAYSAGNLTAVCNEVRAKVGPMRDLVIVADNDESGTGEREAKKAAESAGCVVIIPPVVGDANDYAQAGHDLAGLLEPVAPKDTRYKLTRATDMTDMEPIKWQIKKIIPAQDVIAIYGQPGSGKSFMALDMASHIAEGKEWMGYRTKRANVVYLVLEAANGFSGRLKAWQLHNRRSLPDNFFVITHTPFAFSSASDIKNLIDSIQNVLTDGDGLIVFIDTLARAMGTLEENDNSDMGAVVASAEVISRHLNCAVALIAHPGKDNAKGLRGGSALLGGLDTVIQLNKDATTHMRTWSIEKQKEGEDGLSGSFNLQVVKLGEDDDGDDITSAVVVRCDTPEGTELEKEKSSISLARKYFEDAVMAVGRPENGMPFISDDAWNGYSYKRNHATDQARRTALSKAKRELLDAGYIMEVAGGYTPVPAQMTGIFAGAFRGLRPY